MDCVWIVGHTVSPLRVEDVIGVGLATGFVDGVVVDDGVVLDAGVEGDGGVVADEGVIVRVFGATPVSGRSIISP